MSIAKELVIAAENIQLFENKGCLLKPPEAERPLSPTDKRIIGNEMFA